MSSDRPDPLEPLRLLDERPDPADLERALREFASRLAGGDRTAFAVAREAGIAELRRCKLASPASTLDAALRSGEADDGPPLLREVEPWQEPVCGDVLLQRIEAALTRYAVLPAGAAAVISLWIVAAWAHDCFFISPFLLLTSPERRCGKSTVLLLLAALCPRALLAANVSAAAVYRTIEAWRPTLLLDEAETYMRPEAEALRGILNSGHTRGTAIVVRIEGEQLEPRAFSTWCPKAVALIGSPPATIEDRSIPVNMRRKDRVREVVTELRQDRIAAELEPLARQAKRWTADHEGELREADPLVPSAVASDRMRDNLRPLFSVADLAGCGDRAREAALTLLGRGEQTKSRREELLADLRALFLTRKVDRLPSAGIVEHLGTLERWRECRKGRPITESQLAKLLDPLKVAPTKYRAGEKTVRGYLLSGELQDAFERYLAPLDPEQTPSAVPPPSKVEQAPQAENDRGNRQSQGGTKAKMFPPENSEKPSDNAFVAPVPPREGGSAEGMPADPAPDPLAVLEIRQRADGTWPAPPPGWRGPVEWVFPTEAKS